MEEKVKLIEGLYERVTEYGKTSYELVKLKAVEKASDVFSSFIPHTIFLLLIAAFLLFMNLGLAIWLGEILGGLHYGFFVVAGFNALAGILVHFFMHRRMKRIVGNYIIKMLLK